MSFLPSVLEKNFVDILYQGFSILIDPYSKPRIFPDSLEPLLFLATWGKSSFGQGLFDSHPPMPGCLFQISKICSGHCD